jgi:hypothetical protein
MAGVCRHGLYELFQDGSQRLLATSARTPALAT